MIYLLTAIGLTPGGSSTVHIYTQTIHRTTQLNTQTNTNTQNNTIQYTEQEVKHGTTQLTYTEQLIYTEEHKHRKTQLNTETTQHTQKNTNSRNNTIKYT